MFPPVTFLRSRTTHFRPDLAYITQSDVSPDKRRIATNRPTIAYRVGVADGR
jgi:hypothetical protein